MKAVLDGRTQKQKLAHSLFLLFFAGILVARDVVHACCRVPLPQLTSGWAYALHMDPRGTRRGCEDAGIACVRTSKAAEHRLKCSRFCWGNAYGAAKLGGA